MLNLQQVLIAVFSIALVILLERAFPFILFSKKNPPLVIRFIEKYIPPMVMAALVFYCLKDINFVKIIGNTATIDLKGFVPYIVAVGSTIALHIWKRNALISIFGGTVIYMILIRVL